MSKYPRTDESGNTVWACCESIIGGACGHKTGVVEQRYRVATYSYACTAYVRTTLRRALALQSTENVWQETEYVNTARGMMGPVGWSDILSDVQVWELSKLELATIHRALEWRKAQRKAGRTDQSVSHVVVTEWSFIEAEIYRVLRAVWHAEGKYWM